MVNDLAGAQRATRGAHVPLRRLADIIIASVLLLVVAPLMAIVAIGIKCESKGSPILENEEWVTSQGRRCRSLKFRTGGHCPELRYDFAADQLNRLGELLRYSRIEYLPELISVLWGDLSLIERGAQPRLLRD